MTREEMLEKLPGYAVGELTPAERAEIEQALATDAGLRAELDAIRETVALVSACPAQGVVAKEERLSTGRVDAILSRIVTAPVARKRRWVGPAVAAAGVVLALGLSIFSNVRTTRERDQLAFMLAERNAARTHHVSDHSWDLSRLKNGSNLIRCAVVGTGTKEAGLVVGLPVLDDFTVPATTDQLGFLSLWATKLKKREIDAKRNVLEPDLVAGGYDLWAAGEMGSTEEYNPLIDNPFSRPFDAPLSTFSIDVDTASYANVRRFLNEGQLPPPDSVRLEELVNYFHYAYVPPAGAEPFSVALEAHAAPWEPKHRLVRIGLQGREIDVREAPPANLVFLVDVSGSMEPEDRLPLVQKSLRLLAENLRGQDKVGMVVYAGAAGVVLPPTSGAQKQEIAAAIDRLSAGGSTNGAQGIEAAYRLAVDNFVKDGVNRVILCTDGDFNVGITSEGDLDRLIEEKRKTGVFLSVLGFGRGNYADARMQSLADKGNGNASYIDSLKEAQKVLVEQATGTLVTIAKDVKIQVEFNPAKVAAYRLVGYENRLLAAQDFNDDRKDAGEIGAGHQVTALYEVIPAGQEVPASDVDALKYQETAKVIAQGAAAEELCTVKLRFKAPDGDTSRKIECALTDPGVNAGGASTDFEFAASVAAFAMCLRESEYRGQANFGLVKELAMAGLGDDAKGYRKEFVELVKKAAELAEAKKKAVEEKK